MRADFPDWLSPMLVKELRQGMHSRVYLSLFILLQAAMMLLALLGLTAASVGESVTEFAVFYWVIIVVPLVLIMPMSGLGAISTEKNGNTLEPIFLTRLTARRVVVGKWVALVTQTLLLVTAILPYTVLRYYLGGVNLVTELEALAWTLAGSTLLIALAVGLSPGVSRVGRILIPVVVIIALLFGSSITIGGPMGPVLRVGAGPMDWAMYGMIVLLGCLLAGLALELGAGKIAPAAENHATPKRVIGFAAALAAILYSLSPGAHGWMWTPALVIVGFTLVGTMCEPMCEIPSVYRPFVRRGAAGRLLGRVLYPGWPAGFFFSALLLAAVFLGLDRTAGGTGSILRKPSPLYLINLIVNGSGAGSLPDDLLMRRITEIACAGALFMPAALYLLLPLKKIPALLFYMCFHGSCALLAIFGAMITNYESKAADSFGLEFLLSLIPTCALCLHSLIIGWDRHIQSIVLAGLIVTTLCSIVVLLARMRPAWRAIAGFEKKAASLRPADSPPDAARPAPAS